MRAELALVAALLALPLLFRPGYGQEVQTREALAKADCFGVEKCLRGSLESIERGMPVQDVILQMGAGTFFGTYNSTRALSVFRVAIAAAIRFPEAELTAGQVREKYRGAAGAALLIDDLRASLRFCDRRGTDKAVFTCISNALRNLSAENALFYDLK